MKTDIPVSPGFYWRRIRGEAWVLAYKTRNGFWRYASSARPMNVGVDGEEWSDEVVPPEARASSGA